MPWVWIVHISELPPRRRSKANFDPSADQAGLVIGAGPSRTACFFSNVEHPKARPLAGPAAESDFFAVGRPVRAATQSSGDGPGAQGLAGARVSDVELVAGMVGHPLAIGRDREVPARNAKDLDRSGVRDVNANRPELRRSAGECEHRCSVGGPCGMASADEPAGRPAGGLDEPDFLAAAAVDDIGHAPAIAGRPGGVLPRADQAAQLAGSEVDGLQPGGVAENDALTVGRPARAGASCQRPAAEPLDPRNHFIPVPRRRIRRGLLSGQESPGGESARQNGSQQQSRHGLQVRNHDRSWFRLASADNEPFPLQPQDARIVRFVR